MTRIHKLIVFCLFASMFSACQTAPKKNAEKPVDTKESDLVMMPGKASGNKINAAYQMKGMTLDELKSCAQNLYDLNKTSISLKEQISALNKRNAVLKETEQSLIDRRLKMDTSNTRLVKEFNQEGNKYMENVKQLQANIAEYNNKVSKINLENNAYIIKCNNRGYKTSDLQQLEPALIDVVKNHSESLDIPVFEDTSLDRGLNNPANNGNDSSIHLPGSSRK